MYSVTRQSGHSETTSGRASTPNAPRSQTPTPARSAPMTAPLGGQDAHTRSPCTAQVQTNRFWAPRPGDSAPSGAHYPEVGTRTWRLRTVWCTLPRSGYPDLATTHRPITDLWSTKPPTWPFVRRTISLGADYPEVGTRTWRLCTIWCRLPRNGRPHPATLHRLMHTTQLWVPEPV